MSVQNYWLMSVELLVLLQNQNWSAILYSLACTWSSVCNSSSCDWTVPFECEGNFTMLLDVVHIFVVLEVCGLCIILWNYGTCCISSHLNYYKLYLIVTMVTSSSVGFWSGDQVQLQHLNVFFILFITFSCFENVHSTTLCVS